VVRDSRYVLKQKEEMLKVENIVASDFVWLAMTEKGI
jgi:hypothetical protein